MSNTNRTGLRLVEKPVVTLPDGCRILAFLVVNWAGQRVGKVSGDLNVETAEQILAKFKK